jgi:starch synthase
MRATQPCVVHGVGGLKDTVEDMRTGFVFDGDSPQEQAAAFVDTVGRALELKTTQDDAWQKICIRAASARFSWSKSARQTIELLYEQA